MAAVKKKGSGLEWFVRRGQSVRGPFSSTRVRHFVLEGKLELDDEVSADRHNWQRLGAVDEVVPLQMRSDTGGLAGQRPVEKTGNLRAIRGILVATLVIVALTLGVYFAGSPQPEGERDCARPPGPGVHLEGCRLSGADMAQADLKGARLANAILSAARLSGADLSESDARYVDFTGADLSYAQLQKASLKGANLRLIDATNADFRGADMSFADLGGARVGGAQFGGANLEGAIWVDGRPCDAGNCPR